jgi:DNA-binding GntR family transcriptional regulator
VFSGEFSKDQFYSENKTASELGISRTPVRDALLRLEEEGFIEIFPSKGYRIRSTTRQDVLNLYQLRGAIEGFCSAQLTHDSGLAAEAAVAKLQENLEMQRLLAENDGDKSEFSDLEYEFHLIIINYMKNEEFDRIAASYNQKMHDVLYRFLAFPERMKLAYLEHRELTEIIQNGTPPEAFEYATLHLKASEYINLFDDE